MKAKRINVIIMAVSILIVAILSLYFWNINNIILNSVPSDFVSGTVCPVYSKDCACTGQEITRQGLEFPLLSKIGSSKITTFCYDGDVIDCKCYQQYCPIDSGDKVEIDCESELPE